MTQTSNSLKWILINNSKCLHFVSLDITNTQKLRPAIFQMREHIPVIETCHYIRIKLAQSPQGRCVGASFFKMFFYVRFESQFAVQIHPQDLKCIFRLYSPIINDEIKMKFIFQLDSTLRSQLIKIQISVKERARDKKENGQKAPTSAYVYPLYNGLINISS